MMVAIFLDFGLWKQIFLVELDHWNSILDEAIYRVYLGRGISLLEFKCIFPSFVMGHGSNPRFLKAANVPGFMQ